MGTTQENAAIVRGQTAAVGQAAAAVTQAHDLLGDALATAKSALGDTAGANTLSAAVEEVRSQIEAVQGAVMRLNDAFESAAGTGG